MIRSAAAIVCAFALACDDDVLRGRRDGGEDAGDGGDGGPPALTLAIEGLDPQAIYRPHGSLVLRAVATGSPVAWCRFSVDGSVFGERSEAPFEVTLQLEGLPQGRRIVVLDATSEDHRDFDTARAPLHMDRSPQGEVDGAVAVPRRDGNGDPVPGGWWLAYTARAIGGGFRLYAVPAAGGRPKGLGEVKPGALAASPSAPEIAWRSDDGALKFADLTGDAPAVRDVSAGVAFHGYLADGTLAYVKADRSLWALPPGAAARKLADAADPRKVALLGAAALLFQSTALDGPGDLWSASPAVGSGAPVALAGAGVVWDHRDAWANAAAGFGAFLAGVSATTGLGELRAAPLPGGPATSVAAGVAPGRFFLQPGGAHLAWIDGLDPGTGIGDLHVRDAAGGVRALGPATRAAYAPDGSAFGWLSGAGDLYLGPPQGPPGTPASTLDKVADFELAAGGLAAAVSTFDVEAARGTLHAGRAGAMEELSAGVPRNGWAHAPGGAHLAFLRAWEAGAAHGEAAVVALDGQGRPSGAARALGDPAPLGALRWSPDGAWLAVLRKPAPASAQLDAWLTSVTMDSTIRKVLEAAGEVAFTAEDLYAVAADPGVAGERPLVLAELKP